MEEKRQEKFAVVIDADNSSLNKLDDVLREVSTHGRILVKRAYGNWKKDTLKKWEEAIKRMAIKPQQQFDYVSGKNATDMALVIDTIELLYSGLYDGFAIVSSDSDYTPLAIKLRESGVYVLGFGEKKTPESFRNACDEFIFLENLEEEPEETEPEPQEPQQKGKKPAKPVGDSVQTLHELLKKAWESCQDEDGFALMSETGLFLRRIRADFDPRTYGYKKLGQLLEAFPDHYEIRRYPQKSGGDVLVYRCLF